jgi:hypothetical protein
MACINDRVTRPCVFGAGEGSAGGKLESLVAIRWSATRRALQLSSKASVGGKERQVIARLNTRLEFLSEIFKYDVAYQSGKYRDDEIRGRENILEGEGQRFSATIRVCKFSHQ